MPYYRTRYECYEEDEDLVNVVPAKVTGEHTRRTKVLCHIFDQQEEGLVKKWMECAYEKPTSQLMHVYGSVNRSKESDILVFTERDHESLSAYLNRIDLRSKNNSDLLSTKFAKILRAILRMMKKVLREPAHRHCSGCIKVKNIYLVDGEPRLAFRGGVEDKSKGIKNFCKMVGDIWENKFGDRTLTTELNDMISSLNIATVDVNSSVFLNAVNHPSLLSPEERVLYRSRASQKLKAMTAPEATALYAKLDDKHLTDTWYTDNSSKAQKSLRKRLKLTPAEFAITYKDKNQNPIYYKDNAEGFLRFCRNLEVHMDRQKFKFKEADSDLTVYCPGFLLALHKILTEEQILVDPTPF